MPDQLQLRGGTTTEHETFTGASKEVTIDTTKKTAVVHDASTAGGNPLMREDGANSALVNGSVTEPALAFAAGDADNGIYSPGTDQVAITTNGVERVEWGASEVVFNDGGENYDFRVEGDTNANLLFVDASTDRIGVGTASPDTLLTVGGSNAAIRVQPSNVANASIFLRHGSISTNSGIEADNTAALGLYANGQERARIDSSGRLLVGTTLAPNSETNANLQLVHSAGPQFIFARNDTETTTNEDIGLIRFYNNDDDGNYDECARIAVECESAYTSTSKPTYMRFYTNGGSEAVAERMRITSAGNVGIGTTTVNEKLTVADSASANVYIALQNSTTGTTSADGWYVGAAGTEFQIYGKENGPITFSPNSTERARIDSSGRLLVGTSSAITTGANALLQVGTSGGGQLILGRTDNSSISAGQDLGGLRYFSNAGDTQEECAVIVAEADGTQSAGDKPTRLSFRVTADGASSPTERMRIDNKGSLCLWQPDNTTNAPQDLNGRIFAYNDGTSSSLYIDSRKSTAFVHVNQTYADTGNRSAIAFYRSEAAKGSISIDSSQTYFNTTSDYRLKENILPLSGATDRIKQLKPSQFNFIIEPDKTVDGFIAHEVQNVVPECVIGTKDEVDENGDPVYQGIDQSKLVPLLTAALQEALAEIESLKARVTALEP